MSFDAERAASARRASDRAEGKPRGLDALMARADARPLTGAPVRRAPAPLPAPHTIPPAPVPRTRAPSRPRGAMIDRARVRSVALAPAGARLGAMPARA